MILRLPRAGPGRARCPAPGPRAPTAGPGATGLTVSDRDGHRVMVTVDSLRASEAAQAVTMPPERLPRSGCHHTVPPGRAAQHRLMACRAPGGGPARVMSLSHESPPRPPRRRPRPRTTDSTESDGPLRRGAVGVRVRVRGTRPFMALEVTSHGVTSHPESPPGPGRRPAQPYAFEMPRCGP